MTMMSHRLSVLLLLLCGVLGSLVYFEIQLETPLLTSQTTGRGSENPLPKTSTEPVGRLTIPALAALTETVDRPLFSTDRRPPATADEPPPVVVTTAPVSDDQISFLLNAVIINGAQRMALLQGPDPGAGLIRAEPGQTVEGWLVEEVLPERVVLRRGDQQQELELRKFQPPPQALLPARATKKPRIVAADENESSAEALDLRRPRRPLRGPRLRSQKRNARE